MLVSAVSPTLVVYQLYFYASTMNHARERNTMCVVRFVWRQHVPIPKCLFGTQKMFFAPAGRIGSKEECGSGWRRPPSIFADWEEPKYSKQPSCINTIGLRHTLRLLLCSRFMYFCCSRLVVVMFFCVALSCLAAYLFPLTRLRVFVLPLWCCVVVVVVFCVFLGRRKKRIFYSQADRKLGSAGL